MWYNPPLSVVSKHFICPQGKPKTCEAVAPQSSPYSPPPAQKLHQSTSQLVFSFLKVCQYLEGHFQWKTWIPFRSFKKHILPFNGIDIAFWKSCQVTGQLFNCSVLDFSFKQLPTIDFAPKDKAIVAKLGCLYSVSLTRKVGHLFHGWRREKTQEESGELGPPLTDLWHAPMKQLQRLPQGQGKTWKEFHTHI